MAPKALGIALGAGIGVSLAGAALWVSSRSSKTKLHSADASGSAASGAAGAAAGPRPWLARDRALEALLAEPEALFRRVDARATERLLDALDDLARLHVEAQTCGRPRLFAEALVAKRSALATLAHLSPAARRANPTAAADCAEDLEALEKTLQDYAYNVEQASSLALMEG